jgi:hypothetical protein
MIVFHIVKYDVATKERIIVATKNTKYEARKYLFKHSDGMYSLYIEEEEVPDAPREFYVDCEVRMVWGDGS